MLRHVVEVFWPPEVLKPTQVLGKAANSPWVLFPGQHSLISGERMISKYFAGSFDFSPINWPFFDPFNIVITVM